MFIGHFGAGLASKKIDNRISLGTLFFASQFIDLIWPIFLLIGIEKVAIDPGNTAFTPLDFYYYPFSHSLAGVLFWAILFGAIYFLLKKNKKGALLLGALVLSHWILDLLTHRPDLEIIPGLSYKVGLGLWNSVPATILIESLIFIAGIYFFLKEYKGRSRGKTIAFWCLIFLLSIIYLVNIISPPPPDANAIGYAGLGMWLFVVWAYWVDKPIKIL